MTPLKGVVLATEFVLEAISFMDDDLPLKFRFLTEGTPLFRYSTSNRKKTSLPLPSTKKNNNNDNQNNNNEKESKGKLMLRVQVQDRLGATSHADSYAIVELPSSSINDTAAVTNLVTNATSDLKKLAVDGDPSVVLATMRSITSLLNINTEDDTKKNKNEDEDQKIQDSIEEIEILSKEEITVRANARESLFEVLDSVGESLEPTPDNLYLQAATAEQLTSNVAEQNDRTRMRAR